MSPDRHIRLNQPHMLCHTALASGAARRSAGLYRVAHEQHGDTLAAAIGETTEGELLFAGRGAAVEAGQTAQMTGRLVR